MQREIKFRAWDKTLKKWLSPDGVRMSISGKLMLATTGSLVDFGREVELMQYTGLKDRNGKEIYEGDILLLPTYPSESNPNGEPDTGVVEFIAGAFGWRYYSSRGELTDQFESFLLWNGESDNLLEEEVIGNKYEDML